MTIWEMIANSIILQIFFIVLSIIILVLIIYSFRKGYLKFLYKGVVLNKNIKDDKNVIHKYHEEKPLLVGLWKDTFTIEGIKCFALVKITYLENRYFVDVYEYDNSGEYRDHYTSKNVTRNGLVLEYHFSSLDKNVKGTLGRTRLEFESDINNCRAICYRGDFINFHTDCEKKTSKPDEHNIHGFPLSKDIEEIYNNHGSDAAAKFLVEKTTKQ